MAEGGIGVEQTRTIVASMRKLPKDLDPAMRDECEHQLVVHGREFEPAPFANFATAVVAALTADAAPDDEDRANKIEFHLGVRDPFTGMTKFRGQVDDLGAEVLSQAIDGLSKPCPERQDGEPGPAGGNGNAGWNGSDGAGPDDAGGTDLTEPARTMRANRVGTRPVLARAWPGATAATAMALATAGRASAGTGAGAGAGELIPDGRSAACRRGQALIEALRRFLDLGLGPIQGGERPHVTVTVDYETLRSKIGAAYLDFGGTIDAGTARMLACDASIIPAVLGSPSQVLDVGMASRSFPTATRRAITLRDRGCSFPGCNRPPAWSDAHHVRHWADHGPSDYCNGVLLCRLHHSLIHRGDWEIRWAADGIPEYIPPAWVDPARKPRRNHSHRIPEVVGL